MKEYASVTTTTHPSFMTPFTPEKLKHEIKKLHPDKSPGPSASLTEWYKLVTLISKDSSSFSSTAYGNLTYNLQTGNFLYYNPYTKDTTKTKQTTHPTEVYTYSKSLPFSELVETGCDK